MSFSREKGIGVGKLDKTKMNDFTTNMYEEVKTKLSYQGRTVSKVHEKRKDMSLSRSSISILVRL